MLPDEVRKAVEYLDDLILNYHNFDLLKWQTIRAHLLAREEKVEDMRTLLDLLRTGRDGKQYVYVQSRAGTMVNVTAHLSENSRVRT